MLDDAELLRRYAAYREQAAFAELVGRHLDFVYRVAMRQLGGNAHLAQEVCQEVFVALAKKAAFVANRPTILGWLHTTTRYSAAHHIRSELRRLGRESEAHRMIEPSSNESAPDWASLRSVIDDILGQLSERDRAAILLRFFGNCTYVELGIRLGLTEAGARLRVDRALDKLNSKLASRGITTTAEALALVCAAETAVAAPPALAASVISAVSAAAIGPGVVSSFFIMTATNLKIVIVGTLLAGGLALFLQDRSAKLEIASLHRRVAELETQGKRQRQAERNAADTTESVPPVAEPTATTPSPDAQAVSATSAMMKDPSFAALWRQEKLRQIDKVYGRELAKLNLPSEQRAKLMDLLFERTEAERVGREAGKNARLSDAESNKAVGMANDAVYAEIKRLLGDENYGKFEAAVRSSRVDLAIEDQFGSDLTGAGVPLSDDQFSSLAQIHAKLKLPLNPAHQEPADPNTGLTSLNQSFLVQAGEVLSPAQLSVLRQRLIDQNAQVAYLREHPKAPLPGK